MAFRSGLEEKVADLMVELGVKYEYESTKVPYQIQHNYTPDFLLPNGIYLECKGYWEAEDRRKIKAVKQQHPEIDLRMVFQAPFNKISKKSKTTYAQWCERLDIPWTSFANIPIEWLVWICTAWSMSRMWIIWWELCLFRWSHFLFCMSYT